jgi:hypothetical protein
VAFAAVHLVIYLILGSAQPRMYCLILRYLSDPATLKDKTDAQLYGTIRDGKDKMPAEGDRMNPQDGWSLIAYVRSLSAGKNKAAVGNEPKK